MATAAPRPPATEETIERVKKNFMEQLTKRIGPDKTEFLLDRTETPRSRYADYCAGAVAMFEIIAAMPPNEAAIMMRQIK